MDYPSKLVVSNRTNNSHDKQLKQRIRYNVLNKQRLKRCCTSISSRFREMRVKLELPR